MIGFISFSMDSWSLYFCQREQLQCLIPFHSAFFTIACHPSGFQEWGIWSQLTFSSFLSFSSVHFNRSVMSNSLQPHESQHARPPCPSPTPGVHPNSRPLSQWCHPAISSSVVPFSSCSPIPPSITVFSNESTLRMRLPKYWSFSFSNIPSKEHPGLISFRMDWLDSSIFFFNPHPWIP